MHQPLDVLPQKIDPRPDFEWFKLSMPYPIVNSGFRYMEQGTDLGDLVQGLVSQARSVVSRRNWSLFFNRTDFFPDNLPDGLPEMLWIIREEDRGNQVAICRKFIHHFAF